MLRRILGLLGWLGVALVFAAVAIRFLKPEWQQWSSGLAMAGLVCTLLYMLSQWREVARSFSGREAKFGTVAIVSSIVVLAILVAVNYLGVRHNKRWDLTAAKQFTLSDQTRKILGELQRPLAIKVFAESEQFQRFRDRLDEFQYASKQVNVEYVDAVKSPMRAAPYKVVQFPTVVFEYDGRTERVTSDAEQELTTGLIKIIQGIQQKAYFVQGHGEKDTEGSERDSYSTISKIMESENYGVAKLLLAQQGVPADAAVLIIAGPKRDLRSEELEMLKRYLARGGKILFMLDPTEPGGAGDLAGIKSLLKDWSIEVGDSVIFDPRNKVIAIAATYQAHAITNRFRLFTVFPLARPVGPASGGTSGKFAQGLIETSPDSWGETDLKALNSGGEPTKDLDKGDKTGPLTLAAAVSSPATESATPEPAKPQDPAKPAPKPETRIAVIGDSDFASNGWLGTEGNLDLFMNTVSWVVQQENLISIRPRDPEDRRISLSPDQQWLVLILTAYAIPGLVLLTGVYTWWRRR
jgi:ABC-type uncharacterized transport system involved in gliding motility auxiliary subunit